MANTDVKVTHTPGPWTTDGSRIFHQQNPGGRKYWVAETLNGDDTVQSRKANARLIAKAPELLAIIQGIASGQFVPGDVFEDARRLLAEIEGA